MKTYVKNGLYFITVDSFKIQYWDKAKKAVPHPNYISGGFFANYTEPVNGKIVRFTMPVANLCCDIDNSPFGVKYLKEWTKNKGIVNGKLKITGNQNPNPQFKNKNISTLVVTDSKAYIKPMSVLPNDCKYAISGVPVIENGIDVSWQNYASKQGFTSGNMYATYRNWLGVKNGEIVIISGRTTTGNYISTSEVYKKVRSEGISDLIALDGGGSFTLQINNKTVLTTSENRQINNVIVFS